jgi:membrane fusion protein (multidrug efflux system)
MRVVLLLVVLFPTWCLAQQGPATVEVAPVQRRPVELTQPLVASVEAVTRSTLAAELPGLIAERSFDEGQFLEKGAVLARMKTDLLTAQLNAAKAAEATSEANVAMARAEAENAKEELERNRKLLESKVGSDKEFREAATKLRVTDAMVKSRSAEVEEKKAEVARLQLMIDKSQVVTPVPGVVAERHVEVGQWVKEGDPIAEIVQLDPLWVRVPVPEQVLSRLAKGDEARVTIDALGGKMLTAKVDQILPVADPASRTFEVKLLLGNPDGAVKPGFFARATLFSKSETRFVVPLDAVVSRGPSAYVAVVREGKAVVIPVKRGPTADGNFVAVSGELTEKDLVITRGNEALRGGEDLMVLNPPKPTTATTTAPTTAPAAARGAPARPGPSTAAAADARQ